MNDRRSREHNPDADRPGSTTGPVAIDRRLLEVLVCPVSKGPLRFDPHNMELVSEKLKLAFPIRDGVPIMIPDEARDISD